MIDIGQPVFDQRIRKLRIVDNADLIQGGVHKTRLATPPIGRMEKARSPVKVVTS
jgi:hypothetical protein